MNHNIQQQLLKFQKAEMTEHYIFLNIAKQLKGDDKKILESIAQDELNHYEIWKSFSEEEVTASKMTVLFYTFLARVLGYTFTLKLMEQKSTKILLQSSELLHYFENNDEFKRVMAEEKNHEQTMIDLLNERRLQFVSSIVLGMNDALVEFTGALAGYTFALQNNQSIILIGLITGISASLSMASSEYLATKHENTGKHPLESAIYTGVAYIITVFLLLLPYFIFPGEQLLLALFMMLGTAIVIIGIFNYYISVATDGMFRRRFVEMVVISMGVATISFIIGIILKQVTGINI